MAFFYFKCMTVSRHSGDTAALQDKVAGSQCMSGRTKRLLSLCAGPVTNWHVVAGGTLSSTCFTVGTREEANQPCLCVAVKISTISIGLKSTGKQCKLQVTVNHLAMNQML